MKLTQKQIELVDAQVKRLIAGDSYYGKLYRESFRSAQRMTFAMHTLLEFRQFLTKM